MQASAQRSLSPTIWKADDRRIGVGDVPFHLQTVGKRLGAPTASQIKVTEPLEGLIQGAGSSSLRNCTEITPQVRVCETWDYASSIDARCTPEAKLLPCHPSINDTLVAVQTFTSLLRVGRCGGKSKSWKGQGFSYSHN